MHSSIIITHDEIIRINLNKSDWEIMKAKGHSSHAYGRHLTVNGEPENKKKIYGTNVHLKIIKILMTMMYQLRAVTLILLQRWPCVSRPSL